MLSHVDVRVTDDALNGREVNTQSLHLRHIGMTAAVGRQHTDTGDLLQSLFEMIAEGCGIAGCMYTFRAVLKDAIFGEMFVGSYRPESIDNLFISIQTFNSQDFTAKTTPEFYDYIIVDEFHHAAAPTYTLPFL